MERGVYKEMEKKNRLFLLYFPGYYDGDEIIGIYDNISDLRISYDRVISNPADENGFRYYDIWLNSPFTKLTIEEFDRDNEVFEEVDPEALWSEVGKNNDIESAIWNIRKSGV